jgi:hypothetical protein
VELTGAEAKEGLVWTAVTINLLQGSPVHLDGLDKAELQAQGMLTIVNRDGGL